MSEGGCYRVIVRGARGAVWGPIVDADNEVEAKHKATTVFAGTEPVDAIFLHTRGDLHHSISESVLEALEAKVAQVTQMERRAGGIGLRRIA